MVNGIPWFDRGFPLSLQYNLKPEIPFSKPSIRIRATLGVKPSFHSLPFDGLTRYNNVRFTTVFIKYPFFLSLSLACSPEFVQDRCVDLSLINFREFRLNFSRDENFHCHSTNERPFESARFLFFFFTLNMHARDNRETPFSPRRIKPPPSRRNFNLLDSLPATLNTRFVEGKPPLFRIEPPREPLFHFSPESAYT